MNRMNVYCNNCGNEGHLYRNCKLPVLSYGILCFTDEHNILMIQRKDSISYIEFLRGKYDLNNPAYILDLLNTCSIEERGRIQSYLFDDLWNTLWFSGENQKPQTDRMVKEYHKSKGMFEKLQTSKQLFELLDQCHKKYNTPEWEFPKGRRSTREGNMNCAIREFEEETDLSSDEYILIRNVIPLSEEFTGSNGVRYKHIYYVAIYRGSRDLSINTDRYEQYSEISDIQWLSIDESYSKIRDEHPTKKLVIQDLNKFMINWKGDLELKE